ncbi:MAG TPA: class E sortase [Acidimicrobiales bacterium]|nr:class E sortase [Acidimicrobiales bacterium]
MAVRGVTTTVGDLVQTSAATKKRMARLGRGRKRVAAVAAVVVASLGVGGWAFTSGGSEPGPDVSRTAAGRVPAQENPVPSTWAVPSTRELSSTTTTTAVVLPVPAPAPADAYATTPEVVLGTLSLPTLGVSQPLGEGVTLTALDRSPGHWPGTAMPGQVGNVVVAGHRTTHTKPFLDLDLLRPGDPLIFTMLDGTTWNYQLTGTSIVQSNALHIVDQTPAKTATLFACHPKGSARQRIVASFTFVES